MNTTGETQRCFANLLLAVGNGTYPPANNDGDDEVIRLPDEMRVSTLKELLNFVFGANYNPATMKECAVVAPKNDTSRAINTLMLQSLPGEEYTYFSADETLNDTDRMSLHNSIVGTLKGDSQY